MALNADWQDIVRIVGQPDNVAAMPKNPLANQSGPYNMG